MLTFTIKRTYHLDATPGDLLGPDGKHFCCTIERAKNDLVHPCIPEGTYLCERYHSPTHGDVWLLKNVPGRSWIEIHIVETVDYVRVGFLEGCIGLGNVPGKARGEEAVWECHVAFDSFMEATREENTIRIVVTSN